jgi:type IV secretory pathway TrbF-like protein
MFGKSRSRSEKAAPLLSAQAGRPPGMFDDPQKQFAEIYAGGAVNAQRFFLLNVVLALLLFGAMAGWIISASKNNVAVPWIVEVNPVTGIANRPVRIENLRPSQAVIKAQLADWATKVFTIDKALTPSYFKSANVMTKGLGAAQFAEFRVSQAVVERLAKEPSLQRLAKVSSVDVSSQPGVAFVFVATAESRGNSASAVTARWRMTVKYDLIPPRTEAEILANPLGIYVTSMNVSEEGAVRQ